MKASAPKQVPAAHSRPSGPGENPYAQSASRAWRVGHGFDRLFVRRGSRPPRARAWCSAPSRAELYDKPCGAGVGPALRRHHGHRHRNGVYPAFERGSHAKLLYVARIHGLRDGVLRKGLGFRNGPLLALRTLRCPVLGSPPRLLTRWRGVVRWCYDRQLIRPRPGASTGEVNDTVISYGRHLVDLGGCSLPSHNVTLP